MNFIFAITTRAQMEEIKREDNGEDFKKLSELDLEYPKLDARGTDLIIVFDQDEESSEALDIEEEDVGKINIKLSKCKTMNSMVFPDASNRFKFERYKFPQRKLFISIHVIEHQMVSRNP